MNILLVTQYFWPEHFIINDLVEELVAQGHSVSVMTGQPNYPDGVIYSGYSKNETLTESFIPGVEVFRAPLRPRGSKSAKDLLFNYVSFVFNGVRHFPKAVKRRQFDMIFSVAFSPITAVLPAIYLKKRLKIPLVVWVQDLWPESLRATGYVKNRFALSLVGRLARWIYASTDTLLVQSMAFKQQIKRYTTEEKIIYFPNFYVDKKQNLGSSVQLPSELIATLEQNFCLVFAGNLGIAQSLDTLLDAAAALKKLDKFYLVLVGSGSMESHLKHRIETESLTNVVLAGRYPAELMNDVFKRSSALIVSLKKDELFSYTIPSKVQAYLAAGRPIIASLNGEGASIIEEAGAGLTCPAEDVSLLIKCIKQMYHMSFDERQKMGEAGRSYFLDHFEISAQTQKLIRILTKRVDEYAG
jgi:glycosyltransferase involved in cell wall biosynthesis